MFSSSWRARLSRTPASPICRSPRRASYTIIEVELRRGGHTMAPIFVHVARGPKGLRVIPRNIYNHGYEWGNKPGRV